MGPTHTHTYIYIYYDRMKCPWEKKEEAFSRRLNWLHPNGHGDNIRSVLLRQTTLDDCQLINDQGQ